MKANDPKIILALDYPDIAQARALVKELDPSLCKLKIGLGMFTQYGPSWVEELVRKDFQVFLDLKFHDIPQTVAAACRSAANLGVWMINIHTQGGVPMMEAAVNELNKLSKKPLLIGVTVLTSLNVKDLAQIGITQSSTDYALKLAQLAHHAGLDGIVCSAQEASQIRLRIPKPFTLVTPGIRLSSDSSHDQKRTMAPKAALQSGSDYLVIGRSITHAAKPLEVLIGIYQELSD